jgi:hypothetical protein
MRSNMFRNIFFVILTTFMTTPKASELQIQTLQHSSANSFSVERPTEYWKSSKKAILLCGVLLCGLQIPLLTVTQAPVSTELVSAEVVTSQVILHTPYHTFPKDPSLYTSSEARAEDLRRLENHAQRVSLIKRCEAALDLMRRTGLDISNPDEAFFNGAKSVYEGSLWRELDPSRFPEAQIILGIREQKDNYTNRVTGVDFKRLLKKARRDMHLKVAGIYNAKVHQHRLTADEDTREKFYVQYQQQYKQINSAYDTLNRRRLAYTELD